MTTQKNTQLSIQKGILAGVLLLALLDGFFFQIRSPKRGISWEFGITMPTQPELRIGIW